MAVVEAVMAEAAAATAAAAPAEAAAAAAADAAGKDFKYNSLHINRKISEQLCCSEIFYFKTIIDCHPGNVQSGIHNQNNINALDPNDIKGSFWKCPPMCRGGSAKDLVAEIPIRLLNSGMTKRLKIYFTMLNCNLRLLKNLNNL
jgi:hypothetical protein